MKSEIYRAPGSLKWYFEDDGHQILSNVFSKSAVVSRLKESSFYNLTDEQAKEVASKIKRIISEEGGIQNVMIATELSYNAIRSHIEERTMITCECGMTFQDAYAFSLHCTGDHHRACEHSTNIVEVEKFLCHFCDHSCVLSDLISRHIFDKHLRELEALTVAPDDPFIVYLTEENKYKCVICEKAFGTYKAASGHTSHPNVHKEYARSGLDNEHRLGINAGARSRLRRRNANQAQYERSEAREIQGTQTRENRKTSLNIRRKFHGLGGTDNESNNLRRIKNLLALAFQSKPPNELTSYPGFMRFVRSQVRVFDRKGDNTVYAFLDRSLLPSDLNNVTFEQARSSLIYVGSGSLDRPKKSMQEVTSKLRMAKRLKPHQDRIKSLFSSEQGILIVEVVRSYNRDAMLCVEQSLIVFIGCGIVSPLVNKQITHSAFPRNWSVNDKVDFGASFFKLLVERIPRARYYSHQDMVKRGAFLGWEPEED